MLPKLEEMSDEQLDNSLSQFYTEARSKTGEEYSKSSLITFRNAIERHLNNPPYNRSLKLNSSTFSNSNRILNAKIKSLKQQGKENVQHKEAMPVDDLQKLKAGPVLSLANPWSLLRNVWFHVVLYWCRRGREGQRNLKPTSFAFEVDEQGKRYVTMTHDETTKNHPGGLQDRSSFEKTARMYETESENDGYRALSLYISKLNPKCEALFQQPRRDWNESAITPEIWYENRPLGVNTLGNMMKEISTKAKLSKVYTNHCVRATAITLWSQAGLSDRHICHISGHRNPNSLQHYNSRPSSIQLRYCSDVLSTALQGADQTKQKSPQCDEPFSQPKAAEVSGRVVETHSRSSTTTIHSEMLGGMFNSCTIGSMQINLYPPQSKSQ